MFGFIISLVKTLVAFLAIFFLYGLVLTFIDDLLDRYPTATVIFLTFVGLLFLLYIFSGGM